MQLDDGLNDPNGMLMAPGARPARKPLAPVTVRAFGLNLVLSVTADPYLRDDSYWRLRAIYEPALAAQSLAKSGVAVDVGAGYGCFTVPFALAFSGWTIWAFEPDPEAFAALLKNIQAHKLTNVIAVNVAVAGETDVAADALTQALVAVAASHGQDVMTMANLHALLPHRSFRRHRDMTGILELDQPVNPDFDTLTFPTVPSNILNALTPSLLKLTAPFAEAEVLAGMGQIALDHIIGETWTHLDSGLVYGDTRGTRQTWISRAGDPLLRLRRSKPLDNYHPGLDVVVAMFNSRQWIQDCVDGILTDASPEVRVLVVDDGSTDGSGDLVRELYEGNDRVVLLTKLNGGCASARNFGRIYSTATHLAFVDADDIPGPGLYTGLLELARHTGAEIVQGGFELVLTDDAGNLHRQPSYETTQSEIVHARRHNFGDQTCCLTPSWLLMQGQPTIWRRIYRRDFLDIRNIWFPEHIRAFDDQIFQMLTLQNVADVPMLDGVVYGYRQHARQDINQGDARMFYSLDMFRMILKRGVNEGWNDFRPVLQSFINTVNWCWTGLRPDLRPAFVKGAAELWTYANCALEPHNFNGLSPDQFAPPDFGFYANGFRERFAALDRSYGSIYMDSINMHPDMLASPGAKGRPD
ncbi:MAG: FkbM family methyltransferase [Candidatus Saccharibacteria bacterium]|nr:FkbM family methyltransferase [Pseudorhodobacter sp.]